MKAYPKNRELNNAHSRVYLERIQVKNHPSKYRFVNDISGLGVEYWLQQEEVRSVYTDSQIKKVLFQVNLPSVLRKRQSQRSMKLKFKISDMRTDKDTDSGEESTTSIKKSQFTTQTIGRKCTPEQEFRRQTFHATTRLSATVLTDSTIRFPQGKNSYCVAYSFASALFGLGEIEFANAFIKSCKDSLPKIASSKEDQMLKIGQIIAETCPGFELKKELCMESYDRYCHTDERISIIFPVPEDGFVGH
jgi:hypothetical protein